MDIKFEDRGVSRLDSEGKFLSNIVIEETLDHPLVEWGLNVQRSGRVERLEGDVLYRTILELLRLRTRTSKLDIIPAGIEYKEKKIIVQNKDFAMRSIFDKARYISDEVSRNPQIVGFCYELHNYDGVIKTDTSRGQVTASVTLYLTEKPEPTPVEVVVRWTKA